MTRHYLLVSCIPCAACTAVPVSRPADLCSLLGVPMAPPRHPGVRLTSARRGGTKGPPPVGHLGRRSGGETPLSSAARSERDRKSTRLNSRHSQISYAVFCLKKKTAPT